MKKEKKLSNALTWDDLAEEYKKVTGQSAKTRPMDSIFEWAENQPDKYHVNQEKGTLHKILKR